MDTKQCRKCGEIKPIADYYTNGKQGLYPHCKICKTTSSGKHAPQQRSKPEQKARIKKYNATYNAHRRATDPSYKLIVNLRNRQKKVVHGVMSTTRGLGCDKEFLQRHLQDQWLPGMSWDNYGYGDGKWNVDHRNPLTSFEKTPTGEWDTASSYNDSLLHYTNLQPMWHWDNIKKSNKVVASLK